MLLNPSGISSTMSIALCPLFGPRDQGLYAHYSAHKEARETRYWLRIIRAALLDDREGRALIKESDELVRILYTIVENARQSTRSKTDR